MAAKATMQPREPSLVSQQICSQIFTDSPLKSDQTEFTYSTQNDYGRKIVKLLFCKPKEGFSSHFFENMKEIGAIEGFKVKASNSSYRVRQPKLRAADGSILQATITESLSPAISRCQERCKHLKNHASVLTEHSSIAGKTIGVVTLEKLQKNALDGISRSKLRVSRLYFEGGDCFHLTNEKGIPQFIVGDDLSVVTHQALFEDKWFSQSEKKIDNFFSEEMVFKQYKDNISSRYLSGEIFEKIEERTSSYLKQLSDDEVENYLQEMNQMGIASLEFTTQDKKKQGRELVSTYLAQLDFIKEELFPSELRCRADQVIFSPQIADFLDNAMAPGPKGSIFLQDFKLSVRLLLAIQSKSKDLGLSAEDQEHLQSFIKTTLLLGEDLRPIFEKARKLLEGAGYPVIPAPGAFYSYHAGKPFNINFLNRISGFSEKTGHFFSNLPGTQGTIGELLMDCQVVFQRSICNNVHVYFSGKDPKNEQDFTEAVSAMNHANSPAGSHTLSFEVKIAPHTTKIT